MGNYFNPPEKVQRIGRKLDTKFNYAEMVSQLQEGERLVGLFDRGVFYNAPHLDSESEYLTFMDQVYQRNVQMVGFYALTEEQWKTGGDW